jgi:hypothetical protein
MNSALLKTMWLYNNKANSVFEDTGDQCPTHEQTQLYLLYMLMGAGDLRHFIRRYRIKGPIDIKAAELAKITREKTPLIEAEKEKTKAFNDYIMEFSSDTVVGRYY